MTLDIDLWIWSLDQPSCVSALSRLLSADEQDRADRLVRPGDTERFVVGRGKIREILAIYTGTPADSLSFSYGPQGKPVLPGGPASISATLMVGPPLWLRRTQPRAFSLA